MAQNERVARIDRRILDLLQRNERMTNQRLAEAVALSPSACLAGVSVITGYEAQVDATELVPHATVFAELTASAHNLASTRRIKEALKALPAAMEACQVSGTYGILALDRARPGIRTEPVCTRSTAARPPSPRGSCWRSPAITR